MISVFNTVFYSTFSEPEYSLATASRLANIKRSDDYEHVQINTKASDSNSKDKSQPKSTEKKKNIVIEFNNLDDDVDESAHQKYELTSENRSSHYASGRIDFKESWTFKADGMLRNPIFDSSNTPMSFGTNALSVRKTEHEEIE